MILKHTRNAALLMFSVVTVSTTLFAREAGWSFVGGAGYTAGRPAVSMLNSFDDHRGGFVPKRHHLSFGLGGSYRSHAFYAPAHEGRVKIAQSSLVPALNYSLNLERWQFGVGAMVPTIIVASSLPQLNKVASGIIDTASVRYTVPGARKFTVLLSGSLTASYLDLATYAQWPVLSRGKHKLFYDMGWGVRSAMPRTRLWTNELTTAHGLRYAYGPLSASVGYDGSLGYARSLYGSDGAGIASHTVGAGIAASWKGFRAHLRVAYVLAQSWLIRSADRAGLSVGVQYSF